MQTRNQKSIKFSVFTNTLVFFTGRFEPVFMLSVFGQQLSFHLHLYLLSLQPPVRPGLAFCAHCTLALGSSQSIEFWSVSECEWIQSSTFLLSKVQVQSQGLGGGGGVMEWAAVSPCHGAWWITGTSLSSHLWSLLHDHRTHPPPTHLWPETNFQAMGIADNKIFKLKLKQQAQTQRGETGSKMCTVIYQVGAGESCVSSLSVVFTVTRTHFPLNERRSQPFDLARTICILFLPDSAAFFLHWGCSKFALRVSLRGAES